MQLERTCRWRTEDSGDTSRTEDVFTITHCLICSFITLKTNSRCLSSQLDIVEFIPSLLYFGYTTLMVLTFWLLTGTIGFYAAYMFVRKIYAAVKID